MSINKKKKKRNRKKRQSKRKRRGVSLSSSPVALSSGANSNSSSDSPSSISSASPSTSSISTTIGSAPETSNNNTNKISSNLSNNSSEVSPKRRKKRKPKKRKKRPRKRKGTSLMEAEVSNAGSNESTSSNDATSENNPTDNKMAEGISPTNNSSSESNSSQVEDNEPAIKLTAGQLKRRELQEKKEELRQKKIEKLKEKNPKLYKKIKDILAEQESKIKGFADNLPEDKKAAFLAYSKSLSINSWNQKFEFEQPKDQSSDDNPIDKLTGLNKNDYNYDQILLKKLGPEKVEKLQGILKRKEERMAEFKKTLSEEELGDFEDAEISPRLNKLTNFLESGFSGEDAKDISDLSNSDLQYESSKINFKLLRLRNQGTLNADKVKAKAALENKLRKLQHKLSAK